MALPKKVAISRSNAGAMMFISRISLRPGASTYFGNDYNIHRLVWKFFPHIQSGNPRNFLYRMDDVSRQITLWIVSETAPLPPDGKWKIETKEYRPALSKGMRLEFLLRANPVRTVQNKDGGHSRHDVVIDWIKRYGKSADRAEIVQKAGENWIRAREKSGGFALARIVVDSYQQRVFFKKDIRIKISTMDFSGILTVEDPDSFKKILFHGIGPAKGFGCGLMLVRKI